MSIKKIFIVCCDKCGVHLQLECGTDLKSNPVLVSGWFDKERAIKDLKYAVKNLNWSGNIDYTLCPDCSEVKEIDNE